MNPHLPPVDNPVQREPIRQPVVPASIWKLSPKGKIKPAPNGSWIALPLAAQLPSGVPATPQSSGNTNHKVEAKHFPQGNSSLR
jgi:hypothetical protein